MDIHGLSNLTESPTCYKSSNPSLIDVLLTSHRRRIANTWNVNTGISDFHNLVACGTKMHVSRNENRYIHYRNYKFRRKILQAWPRCGTILCWKYIWRRWWYFLVQQHNDSRNPWWSRSYKTSKNSRISSAVYEFQITQRMPSKGNAAEQIFQTRQIWTFMGPLPKSSESCN